MPKFLTRLDVEHLSDEQWKLSDDLVYQSDIVGLVTVPKGFVTDFASVPRLPGAYWVAGGKANKEAVVHDFLYRSKLCTRKEADDVFLEAMELNGQSWWRRRLMWAGVRLFGWTAYPKEST